MSNSEQEAERARNAELRDQVDSMLVTFEQERRELAEVQARLAATTGEAWSSDNLVRVVSNVSGIPIEVHLTPESFKRSTPERLSRSITEAAQAAARSAVEQSEQATAALHGAADQLPDLPDIVPGAPSIKDLMQSMVPEPAEVPPPPSPPMDDEEEDDYYRNRSYLDDRR
ncbi:YbaB/EbfC family nucleoid-associated protein [Nocardia mexicana]|uniref:YbaB/EbfC DNA-binding family protein n=1 Tax=Nocardia mexicana TaxID=279262 RepID=A0A370GZ74_9NOCA|nr:YbaB/EbfC family nucleoid-associated protein [Nocardia mexicana]RDI48964.1 YbaB/EbfC DNA-binding family protein [Nocardia mexicana]